MASFTSLMIDKDDSKNEGESNGLLPHGSGEGAISQRSIKNIPSS